MVFDKAPLYLLDGTTPVVRDTAAGLVVTADANVPEYATSRQ